MPAPSDPSLAPPKTNPFSSLSWWWLYVFGGGYGLWQAASSGGHHVPALTLFMAVLMMTLPMIVVHELGHYLAGRLLGLHVIEFNLGTGPVLWERTVRDLRVVIRQKPLCGHVTHLQGKQDTRLKSIVFIAAGPLANILLAVFFIRGWDVRLTDFFRHPTLPAICAVANLWQALISLNPIITPRGVVTDGFQLWCLLRGKSVRSEAAAQSFQKRRKTGLLHLQAAAKNSRDVLLLAVFILIGIFSVLLFGMFINGIWTAVAGVVAGLLVVMLLVAWRISRRPWMSFVRRSERAAANPHTAQIQAYSHAMASQAEQWSLLDLPADLKLEVIRLAGDPARLPWLDTVIQEWPQVRHLQLIKFDILLSAKKNAEAAQVMQAALGWEDLLPEVRTHFESCLLAARLCAVPDEACVAACEASINAPLDEGQKMQRLHALAGTAASSHHAALLPKAREWCERAHQIYPFDPATLTLMGIISAEQGRTTEARSWLQSAAAADRGRSAITTAWLAIVSAMEGHPQAPSLLRKSLKQELSFFLKRRLEETLAAIPA